MNITSTCISQLERMVMSIVQCLCFTVAVNGVRVNAHVTEEGMKSTGFKQ